MNQLYNIADIGLNTSDGEGYGLCQLEHMYTGAPQVVTDVGSYSTFLTSDVCEIIPRDGKVYFPGGMPLGLYSYHFSTDSVAKSLETMIERLPEARNAVAEYQFKSWASICDDFLGDVLTESANVSK
jgi:hypothetical protein